jgi:hypothetical protein
MSVNGCSASAEKIAAYQDIDLAEAFDHLRDQRLHLRFVAHVESETHGGVAAVLRRDLGGKLAAVGDVGDHNLGAFRRQRARIMRADALGPAGDDRSAARKPCHR